MPVNLGDASTGFAFIVFDRDASPMSGGLSFDFSVYGNLSNIVQIGPAETGFTLEVAGELIDDPRVMLEPANTGFSFSADAAATVKLTLGTAVTGFSFAVAAAINRAKTMAGTTGFTMTVAGDLTRYAKQFLPAAQATFQFDVNGTLISYVNIGPAPAGFSFDVQGILSKRIYLSGTTGFHFDLIGALFNNPAAPDLDTYTMIRPYVDRIMVRRS